jgi:predicted DNA-binding transcriptional regulator YafY
VRRADRLFDIIQILRTAKRPVTAAMLAEKLEVTPRTVYRDVATLQARRIPIDGEAGVGYVLRRGFDLPPLMFTTEEVEAIVLGARMIPRLRDAKLQRAAESVLDKVTVVLPEQLRAELASERFYVSGGSARPAKGIDLGALRGAIRDNRKMRIAYVDERGTRTRRTIWPIAMAYYVDVTVIGAWCELRKNYRHFRVERVATSSVLDQHFVANPDLLQGWMALGKERMEEPL